MNAGINKSAAQHQEAEKDIECFEIVLNDVSLKSDIFLRILSVSISINTLHKNNLYRSNLMFSRVLRGTQSGPV